MGRIETEEEIEKLTDEIRGLPRGRVAEKRVGGKTYYYLRFSRDGKRVERSLGPDPARAEAVRADIERRKGLEMRRDALTDGLRNFGESADDAGRADFFTEITTGKDLKDILKSVSSFKKRECFRLLRDYVFGDEYNKVFIMYGLRRTGKTTMIRQVLGEMSGKELERAAYVQIKKGDTLALLNKDLRALARRGFRYVFIDEVTKLEEFIDGASLFSDVYAACGMKIILSGTDSLGFLLSSHDELYDRCHMLHTTFIPYREFEDVLGVKGIDEYIRRGGTMTVSGENYNGAEIFDGPETTNGYVDSAIAENIQHSLKHYQDGTHFRHLRELYDRGELTSAINRVVEDMNHRFTVEVLTEDFKSNDLALSARNLRKDRNDPDSILDDIDTAAVTERLKTWLDILNEDEQTVRVSDIYAEEIKEYLYRLDLVYDIDEFDYSPIGGSRKKTIISQPGLRYSQATALVDSVMRDGRIRQSPAEEREKVKLRIYGDISGRMMEEIVLLETALAKPKSRVFKLRFDVGEFDMVVQDPAGLTCEIYEIKYSAVSVPGQLKNLDDDDLCEKAAYSFGRITGKYLIYRGETRDVGDVRYLNVEEYLKGL